MNRKFREYGYAVWFGVGKSEHRCLSASGGQRGFALSEYLMGTSLVALALFAPVPILGDSVFVYLLNAMYAFQANTTYLMSLP